MSGAKIIQALEDAQRGDFSRVTVAGHVWIRDGVDKAEAWDAVIAARRDEREKCAQIAISFGDFPGERLVKDLRVMCGRAIADKIREVDTAISLQQNEGAAK
jgi:hypothetical protein